MTVWFMTASINPFPVGCGITYFNLPPMSLDEISTPNKISRYNPYQLPDTVSVDSGNYFITLTTPYKPPQNILLSSETPSTDHKTIIEKYRCSKEGNYTSIVPMKE